MIRFEQVSVTYADAPGPVLRDVDLEVPEGELCLVVGRTGAGKSTLLGAINGLVPHFTGGTLAGRVVVDGRDTRTHPPRELADVVGVVSQDPLSGFVTDIVEDELAYGMEQLGLPPDVMRKRVEETLDLLGLAELRRRALHELSGGQQQRVAIGAVLTAHPRVLVLDEPTSALDPTAAEEVLAAITRLVHDLGVTVVLAEHRLERVVQYADRVLYLPGDGTVRDGAPSEVFGASAVAPPVIELGRLAGWSPLPLSVRDARRAAGPLRERLHDAPLRPARPPAAPGTTLLSARNIIVRYGEVIAVRRVNLTLRGGAVVALMGRNGSGKSSLLWSLQGSGPRAEGEVSVLRRTSGDDAARDDAAGDDAAGDDAAGHDAADDAAIDPHAVSPARARALVALVPQTPADLLYLETVDAELAQADAESIAATAPDQRAPAVDAPAPDLPAARHLLDRLAPGIPGDFHPRDLSEGQRLALVLAIQLRAAPSIVLLDEPTRGLDYAGKQALTAMLDQLAAQGRAVVVATHDVEFVAASADRVVVMAEGEIVADGPTEDVIVASPAFAPQTAKILAPQPFLTVAQVADALASPATGTDQAPRGSA